MEKPLVGESIDLFDYISTPIMLVSVPDRRIAAVNREAIRLLRQNRGELLGKCLTEIFCDKDQARLEALMDLANDNTVISELEVQFAGTRKLAAFANVHVRTAISAGRRDYIVTIHDVTHLRRAKESLELRVEERTSELRAEIEIRRAIEQKMIANAKMTALGEMAGGVAHEINTPLAIIIQYAGLLREMLAETPLNTPELVKMAEVVESTVFRIAKIVKGLLAFAREGEQASIESISAKQLIEDTLRLCQEKFLSFNIRLEASAPENILVECRPFQICEVLVNLLNNAFDVVKDQQNAWVSLSVDSQEGRVLISVTDGGPGIPADIREKIFAPFFTTKPIGSGTGLGLSTAQGIVASHGGSLTLDLASAHTRFVVSIPSKNQPKS